MIQQSYSGFSSWPGSVAPRGADGPPGPPGDIGKPGMTQRGYLLSKEIDRYVGGIGDLDIVKFSLYDVSDRDLDALMTDIRFTLKRIDKTRLLIREEIKGRGLEDD